MTPVIADQDGVGTSPVQAVRSVLEHCVGFRGRARRSEFWWWALATAVLFAITATADEVLLGDGTATATATSTSTSGNVGASSGPITAVVFLALLLPDLSVVRRRLDDSNRSGGWSFISFVPVVGTVVLVVLLCLDSTPGSDRFGASPEQVGDDRGAVAPPAPAEPGS